MSRIAFVIPYYGQWPFWINAFLETCKLNPKIDWIFFTDLSPPENQCPNVTYIKMTINELTDLIATKLDIWSWIVRRSINKKNQNYYKLCDYKTAYLKIFEDYIKEYDFIGVSDIDLLYGRLRGFLPSNLNEYILLSFHKHLISGHLFLIKNDETGAHLYQRIPKWKSLFKKPTYQRIDELYLFDALKNHNRVYFTEAYSTPLPHISLFNLMDQKFYNGPQPRWLDGTYNYPTEWYWKDGVLTNNRDGERQFMYYHFLDLKNGFWPKNKQLNSDFDYKKRSYKISADGISNY